MPNERRPTGAPVANFRPFTDRWTSRASFTLSSLSGSATTTGTAPTQLRPPRTSHRSATQTATIPIHTNSEVPFTWPNARVAVTSATSSPSCHDPTATMIATRTDPATAPATADRSSPNHIDSGRAAISIRGSSLIVGLQWLDRMGQRPGPASVAAEVAGRLVGARRPGAAHSMANHHPRAPAVGVELGRRVVVRHRPSRRPVVAFRPQKAGCHPAAEPPTTRRAETPARLLVAPTARVRRRRDHRPWGHRRHCPNLDRLTANPEHHCQVRPRRRSADLAVRLGRRRRPHRHRLRLRRRSQRPRHQRRRPHGQHRQPRRRLRPRPPWWPLVWRHPLPGRHR